MSKASRRKANKLLNRSRLQRLYTSSCTLLLIISSKLSPTTLLLIFNCQCSLSVYCTYSNLKDSGARILGFDVSFSAQNLPFSRCLKLAMYFLCLDLHCSILCESRACKMRACWCWFFRESKKTMTERSKRVFKICSFWQAPDLPKLRLVIVWDVSGCVTIVGGKSNSTISTEKLIVSGIFIPSLQIAMHRVNRRNAKMRTYQQQT